MDKKYLKSVIFLVKLALPVWLCWWPLGGAYSQTVLQLVKAGDTKFSEGDFYAAALYYKDALRKDADNPETNFKYAEASRLYNDYSNAITGYRAVTKLDKNNRFPLAWFWLGEMLRSTCECKVEEAIVQFKRFRTKYRKKDYYSAKCQQSLESCAWVLDNRTPAKNIQIEHLGKDVNTEESEFNAIHVFPDKIQYSALRNVSTDKKQPDYKVRLYNQPPNPNPQYMPNGANAELHIGNGAYTPDTRTFYFTQCEPTGKSASRCDIYITRFDDYKWQPAQKLSNAVNSYAFTSTQPAPGLDAAGNEILFFASDRDGGYGGFDIWFSRKNSDGSYSNAINAGGVINTPGNEITPFYDVNNKKLFFSSDWHYGFGGYDIFETRGADTTWSVPTNLRLPINTPQNDLYYTLAADDSKAYITSNRKGSYFIQAETCCNDIYAYATGKKTEKRDTVALAKTDTPPTTTVVVDTTTIVEKKDTPTVVPVEPTPPVAVAEVPPKIVNEKLRNVKQLLPVTLYFHNDEPDARNLSDTTRLDYRQTYEAYAAMYYEYIREFARGTKGVSADSAEIGINRLYDDYVDKGYRNLVAFTSQLLELLTAGNRIEVTIKGYCSPLNFNQYNIHLGNRRVASLRNYFFHYRDGLLLPFIASGSLVLKSESLGEETAPMGISDNREDKRNSVYHPAAALERRVEIISVELK